MRRIYLMEHQPATYSTMIMTGELFPHLYQMDKQAELILKQMTGHYLVPNRNADPIYYAFTLIKNAMVSAVRLFYDVSESPM